MFPPHSAHPKSFIRLNNWYYLNISNVNYTHMYTNMSAYNLYKTSCRVPLVSLWIGGKSVNYSWKLFLCKMEMICVIFSLSARVLHALKNVQKPYLILEALLLSTPVPMHILVGWRLSPMPWTVLAAISWDLTDPPKEFISGIWNLRVTVLHNDWDIVSPATEYN